MRVLMIVVFIVCFFGGATLVPLLGLYIFHNREERKTADPSPLLIALGFVGGGFLGACIADWIAKFSN
jgi:hypothetical protein